LDDLATLRVKEASREERTMNAETMTTRSLIRIRESAALEDAARLMCDMSMGALGVDDADHRFIGLVTERDLLWAMAQGKDSAQTTVRDIVNDFPIVVDGPISSGKAAERMMSAHVRHLLVRDDDHLGIISLRDVVRGWLVEPSTTCTHPASTAELRRMFGKSFL
jgi:predicted transcriptional regulator